MRIVVDARGEARLEEADDFRTFSLAAEGDGSAFDAAVARIGRPEGQSHVWVSRAWLMENGRPADPEWLSGFEKMVRYAARAGWLDEGGAVRAHIVRAHGEASYAP